MSSWLIATLDPSLLPLGRHVHQHLKEKLERQRLTHEQALLDQNETHRSELERLKIHHQQQIHDYQHRLEQLTTERDTLDQQCQQLSARVNSFLESLAENENADAVLTTLEKLEKDRTSLETVLEMKNEELNQLRAKINEQVFQVGNKSINDDTIDESVCSS